MMALPLSLIEIRREQRRVAALLGASKQLAIVVPPYHGISSQNLYRSKYHTQLGRGKANQSASTPAAISSLPEFNTKETNQNGTEGQKSSKDLAFSDYSKPFIPAGSSRNNYHQLFSRHAFAGHQDVPAVPAVFRELGKGMRFSLPIARDSDIFLASSKNVTKKQFIPERAKQIPFKKEYSHDDFARTNYFKSNVISTKKPRPKRKKPPDDEIEYLRQPKESMKIADYRLPKPKKSETLPMLPVPKDTSFAPKRTFSPPKPKPIKKYHQDVIGQGVDVPLHTEDSSDLQEEHRVKSKSNKVFPKPAAEEINNKPPPPPLTRKSSNVFEGFHRRKSSPQLLGIPDRLSPHGTPPAEPCTDSGPEEMDNDSKSEATTKSDEGEGKEEENEEDEEEEQSSDEEMEEHISPTQSQFPDSTWHRPPSATNTNPWSEAYRKAIAAARRRNLPTLDDFNQRFTRPYTYSYFRNDHKSTCQCNICQQNKALKDKKTNKKKKSKKAKARSEMKKILGNVKIYDYFKFTPHER